MIEMNGYKCRIIEYLHVKDKTWIDRQTDRISSEEHEVGGRGNSKRITNGEEWTMLGFHSSNTGEEEDEGLCRRVVRRRQRSSLPSYVSHRIIYLHKYNIPCIIK